MASKTYDKFVTDLNKSQKAVLAVTGYLQRKGRICMLPPHKVTPTEKDRFNYQDGCDLLIARPVQVKWSSREFDSVKAFGFEMVTVDEVYKIDFQKEQPPIGYFIVNAGLTGAIYIPWETKPQWDTFKSPDKFQGGRLCCFYRCPARWCRFISL